MDRPDPLSMSNPRAYAMWMVLYELLKDQDSETLEFAWERTARGDWVPLYLELMKLGIDDFIVPLTSIVHNPEQMKTLPSWMQNAMIRYAQVWWKIHGHNAYAESYGTRPGWLSTPELDLDKVFPGGMR